MKVDNGKRGWYEILIERMSNALESGFYFEVLFLSYMIIDDRIKSLCEVRGISLVKANNSPKMLGTLVSDLESNISTNDLAKQLFSMPIPIATVQEMMEIHNVDYLETHARELVRSPRKLYGHTIDTVIPVSIYSTSINEPHGILDCINKWKMKRNHWMHQAGDDNLTNEELIDTIIPLALDGAVLARELCDFITSYKSRISINSN